MLINEIYQSIEGEVSGHHQGAVTTFIRTQGCNLRCEYCDSKYTWDEGKGRDNLDIEDILSIVNVLGNKNVTITGGEPMMQEQFSFLVNALWDKNYNIAVETNGTFFPDPFVREMVNSWIVDWKWGIEPIKIRDASIYMVLEQNDFIKFIIKDKEDFNRAIKVKEGLLSQNLMKSIPKFAFSPCHGVLEPNKLVGWILELKSEERKDIILNLQIHKYIWPVERRGV